MSTARKILTLDAHPEDFVHTFAQIQQISQNFQNSANVKFVTFLLPIMGSIIELVAMNM